MSLPVPLNITLATTHGTHRVTNQVRDLTLRTVVPGGFASAEIALDRPLALPAADVDYFARLVVTDGRTGDTVWEGRVEDPGRSAGTRGQVWRISAIGPSAHTTDLTTPLIYVDTALSSWTRDNVNTARSANVSISDTIDMQIPRGVSDVISTYQMRVGYSRIADADLSLGRVVVVWTAGNSDTNHRFKLRFFGSITDVYDSGWTTGPTTATTSRGGANDIPAGDGSVQVMYQRINSTVTIADDTTYQSVTSAVVQSRRYNASGSVINSGYSSDTVLASQIVNDLLGRILVQYDGPNAVVTTTSYGIDQLAYPDGVTAREVLDDLMELEPAYYWAAWERQTNGLYRFEWVTWPTTIRYEADVTDGFESPGSAAELYNAVRVRYRKTTGAIATLRRTQTVTALDDAGIEREAFLDLGEDVGTSANAQQAGDQFLAGHAMPPNAGRLTVARPIFDRNSGRMVAPWEIRPGALIRVRGVLPRVDALNASARDGTTVFKIASSEFNAGTAAATLELDSYTQSTARALADVAKTRKARHRRR